MATAFRVRTNTDSGGKILSAAGSLITVLDDLLTLGTSPWTKTTNGTNDVTYTAPAGSQVKLRVFNNTAHTTNFIVKFNCQVGSNPVFPTTTQETATGQGIISLKARNSSTTASSTDVAYIGIRTDRFMLLMTTGSDGNPASGGCLMFAGDIPTIDGSDPGLCVGSGFTSTSGTSTSTTANTSITGSLIGYNGASGLCGYADKAVNGTTNAVPAYFFQTLPAAGMQSLANSFSSLLLGRILIGTSNLTTSSTVAAAAPNITIRGYVPYIFAFPAGSGYAHLDTFTDSNGASYTIVQCQAAQYVAVMTSDNEAGMP